MDMKEAIQELGNVVNACSYLMPKVWQDAHMEDAKEAIRVLSAYEDVEWAREYLTGEKAYWEGIDDVCARRRVAAYKLALDALG